MQLGLCAYFVYAAALGAWQGIVGLLVTLVAGALLIRSLLEARQAAEAVRAALAPVAPMPEAPLVSLWERRLLFPWPWRPKDVRIDRKVPFCDEEGCRLFADIVRPAAEGTGRAALIFVHGGGWVTGQKGLQGLPLMYRFAQAGWVCFSIDYRRSPRATFPAHIIDVKRGIAWVKANADRYGIDPTQVAISGSSAGGHLASLAALSPSDPAFQPGFEAADTSLIACLSFYGIYDFTDRHGLWPHRGLALLLRLVVMKRRLDDTSRPFYEQASYRPAVLHRARRRRFAGAGRGGAPIRRRPARRLPRAGRVRGDSRRPARLRRDPLAPFDAGHRRGASVRGGDTGPTRRYRRLVVSEGRLGKWRSPIHASAAMWLATSSTGGLRTSVHHCPTNVTMPIRAWA